MPEGAYEIVVHTKKGEFRLHAILPPEGAPPVVVGIAEDGTAMIGEPSPPRDPECANP